uniref:Uncharacterized protein n=1 Tax=Triticum urartu TaxID=4572 RepID=A0A8R7R6B4_TRIUA
MTPWRSRRRLSRRPSAARARSGRAGTSGGCAATCRCSPHGTGACTAAAAAPSRRPARPPGTPRTAAGSSRAARRRRPCWPLGRHTRTSAARRSPRPSARTCTG